MIDVNGENYYKIGRGSNKELIIQSCSSKYKLSIEDIKLIHEIEVDDEVFAEKLLFNILEIIYKF